MEFLQAQLDQQAKAKKAKRVRSKSSGGLLGDLGLEQDDDDNLVRRSGRAKKARTIEIDGHAILKVNNYALEHGEPSVDHVYPDDNDDNDEDGEDSNHIDLSKRPKKLKPAKRKPAKSSAKATAKPLSADEAATQYR
jgi:hypothetical protein